MLWKIYLKLLRNLYFFFRNLIYKIFLFSRNTKTKKFFQTNEVFPIESYIQLLDFVDRPNPALSRELRASLAKSATILSVRQNSRISIVNIDFC